MQTDLARDPEQNPWDKIYQREGRIFTDPFPAFGELVECFQTHRCRFILDLGCGTGRHVVQLGRLGYQVVGMDSASAGLRAARLWCQEEGLRSDLVVADMRRPFPFRTGFFEGVMATQVIHHAMLRTVQKTAGQIDRVLASGGVLFVTVPTHKNLSEDYIQVEAGTWVPMTGSEKGLPHHIFSLAALRGLFPGYRVLDLTTRGDVVNALLAVKP